MTDAGCAGPPHPKWGQTDKGWVMHLTAGRVGEHLGLYFARCQGDCENPYLLSTFPTEKGVLLLLSWGHICKRCLRILVTDP